MPRQRTGPVLVDSAPLVSETVQSDEVAVPAPTEAPTNASAPTVSLLNMTVNLITGGLGSGILTLAWGMAGASVLMAVVITFAVIALNGFTVMLLVHAAEKHQRFDLGALLCMLPGAGGRVGQTASGVSNALVWITMWMTQVGYIIIVQDCLTALFPSGSVFAHRAFWGVISGAIVLPLSWMPLKYLSLTSSPISVGVNCYLFGLLCVKLGLQGVAADGPCVIARFDPPPTGVFAYLSLISNTIIIQMCILPMYKDLERRSPRRFGWALGASFGFLFLLFSAFATVSYMLFGPSVPANVLKALGEDGWDVAARVGMSVVVLCVYPIMVVPMYPVIEELVAKRIGGGRGKRALATKLMVAGVVASATVCTLFVKDLGLVNVICGTISQGGFTALAPGLAGLWLYHSPGVRMGVCWRVGMHSLIWAGLTLSIVGVFFRDNFVGELTYGGACWWRLGNATNWRPWRPPQPAWPVFATPAALGSSAWGDYYKSIYGALPLDAAEYPLDVGENWVLFDSALASTRVPNLPAAQPCSKAPTEGDRYLSNDAHQPPSVSWIWHAYPTRPLAGGSWVEVLHEADSSTHGMWTHYAPGSGIWLLTGKTIAFADHGDAYAYFHAHSDALMCEAAASQGYDTIQFTGHSSDVTNPCDTQKTGRPGIDYAMGLEIVAVKLSGANACGSALATPAEFRRGWRASEVCVCNNTKQFLNCEGVPSLD